MRKILPFIGVILVLVFIVSCRIVVKDVDLGPIEVGYMEATFDPFPGLVKLWDKLSDDDKDEVGKGICDAIAGWDALGDAYKGFADAFSAQGQPGLAAQHSKLADKYHNRAAGARAIAAKLKLECPK